MAKPVVKPKGISGYGKNRMSMGDASTTEETDRGRASRAEAVNPRPAGVGTARGSVERKYGRKA